MLDNIFKNTNNNPRRRTCVKYSAKFLDYYYSKNNNLIKDYIIAPDKKFVI